MSGKSPSDLGSKALSPFISRRPGVPFVKLEYATAYATITPAEESDFESFVFWTCGDAVTDADLIIDGGNATT